MVVVNIWKVWRKWARLYRILGREGVDPRISGNFYKAIVQAILLFCLDTWVMKPRIGRTLGRSHHRVVRHTAGINTKRYTTRRWEYQPPNAAILTVGLDKVDTYVFRQ